MSDPFICTEANPWTPEKTAGVKPLLVLHPDAREVGEQEDGWPGGDIVTMQCPRCGFRWTKELPQ